MEPVALGIQQPNFVGNMSQLLGLQQQKQAIAGQAADVQMKQQDAKQRQFLSQYDFTKHLASDGTPDLNSLISDPELRSGAGDSFPEVIQHAAAVKQQQYQAMTSLTGLRNEQRSAFSEMMGGLRQKEGGATQDDVQHAMEQYYEMYGKDALPVVQAYLPQLKKVPEGKLDGALQSVQMQSVAAGGQLDRGQPNLVDRGPEMVNVNPLTPPSQQVGPIKKDIAPGASLVNDAFGQTHVFNPQTNSTAPIGTGRGKSGGVGGGFVQPVAGQHDIMGEISGARSAGGQVANASRNINDELMRLSADTKTGPGTSTWHHVLGAIGAPVGLEPSAAYQKIGAYLDRQAAMTAQSMGVPNTNAGLAAAASASGTPEYSPSALQEKVKFSDAMNSGAIAYRKGIDKTIGTGPTPDLTKYQAYKSSWANNFDPDIFRVEDAQRRGDKAELTSIRQRLGKNGMATLKTKSENLRKLENGEIP